MNQLKHVFILPAAANNTSLRSSLMRRSASTNGRDPKRSRDLLISVADSDNPGDIKLSTRSYAKLISDYSKTIENRNSSSKILGDGNANGPKIGFFSKQPFERLSRISSLVRTINVGNNGGTNPRLSTRSSSGPPTSSIKRNGTFTIKESKRNDPDVSSRAGTLVSDERMNLANPLVREIVKTSGSGSSGSKDFSNAGNNGNNNSSVKHQTPDATGSDTKNVSVVVMPFRKSDRCGNELSIEDNGDCNTMLVTVTEESKSSSTSKTSPLRHIDLQINGEPGAEVDTVISRIEKLDVISSAERIEIRIPVVKNEKTTTEKSLETVNSTINLCISRQKKDSQSSNGNDKVKKAEPKLCESGSGISKPVLSRASTFFVSKVDNVKTTDSSSAYQSKVVPWWTTTQSFRCSETATAHQSNAALTAQKTPWQKTSSVDEGRSRGRIESRGPQVKEVNFGDLGMRLKPVTPKPNISQQFPGQGKKDTSANSKIIRNGLKKNNEHQNNELNMSKQLSSGRLRTVENPSVKPDTIVKSTISNETKKGTPRDVTGSTTRSSLGNSSGKTLASSKEKLKTDFKPTKRIEDTTNNLTTAGDSKGRTNSKPTSAITKPFQKPTAIPKYGGTTSSGQVQNNAGLDRNVSKIGTKPQQEVKSKSEADSSAQFTKTFDGTGLLASSKSTSNSGNVTKNECCVSQPINQPSESISNTPHKISKVKNLTRTTKPMEKKKDGTLIDYGITLSTGKKPERKLSDSPSTTRVQGKKITTKQEEPAVVATIKEVIPKSNRDIRSSAINRDTEDTARSRQNGPHKNRQRTIEARDTSRTNNSSSMETKNEQNESGTWRTPVKSDVNSKATNEPRVVETANSDKKLLYSVWLRRFKERTEHDHDPAMDPVSRDT